jgi:AmiR/NasT family two-component response regulator
VRARLVIAVPLGPRALLPSAHISQRREDGAVADGSDGAELERLAGELDVLAHYADAQEKKVVQLEGALESRVVIERAVGMLAERFEVGIAEAFDLLRRAARDSRGQLSALAAEVTASRTTPPAIAAALGRR